MSRILLDMDDVQRLITALMADIGEPEKVWELPAPIEEPAPEDLPYEVETPEKVEVPA